MSIKGKKCSCEGFFFFFVSLSSAVGDDIKEMCGKSMQNVLINNFPAFDVSLTLCRKTVLAAVNGYAVGLHIINLSYCRKGDQNRDHTTQTVSGLFIYLQ